MKPSRRSGGCLNLEAKRRILGLDIGDRYIGVALSDPGRVLATPLTIVERSTDDAAIEAITGIIVENGVGRVIIGLPLSLDGQSGHQAKKVEAFSARLIENTGAILQFRDERYTTLTAKRLLRAGGRKKRDKNKRDDSAAAALILQGYLDETRPLSDG